MENQTQRNEMLIMNFSKEICNNFNELGYKYKLQIQEEILVLYDADEETKINVVALDNVKLFKLKDEAAYVKFDSDKNDYNCCEINDYGIIFLRKCFLENEKVERAPVYIMKSLLKVEKPMALINTDEAKFTHDFYKIERTLKARIETMRSCTPKREAQYANDPNKRNTVQYVIDPNKKIEKLT